MDAGRRTNTGQYGKSIQHWRIEVATGDFKEDTCVDVRVPSDNYYRATDGSCGIHIYCPRPGVGTEGQCVDDTAPSGTVIGQTCDYPQGTDTQYCDYRDSWLDGAVDPVVSPDGKNVYVHRPKTNNGAILSWDRNQDTGILSNVRAVAIVGSGTGHSVSHARLKISSDGKNLYTQGGNNADSLVAWVRSFFLFFSKDLAEQRAGGRPGLTFFSLSFPCFFFNLKK